MIILRRLKTLSTDLWSPLSILDSTSKIVTHRDSTKWMFEMDASDAVCFPTAIKPAAPLLACVIRRVFFCLNGRPLDAMGIHAKWRGRRDTLWETSHTHLNGKSLTTKKLGNLCWDVHETDFVNISKATGVIPLRHLGPSLRILWSLFSILRSTNVFVTQGGYTKEICPIS